MSVEILHPPKAAILKVEGTNCDFETQAGFKIAGAPESEIIHLNQLRSQEKKLGDYQIICLPGGFSYGDDIASGRVFAIELQTFLADQLLEHSLHKGRPIIGICNGFQILVQTGLLPFGEITTLEKVSASLSPNDSGKFESRWIYLRPEESVCQFSFGERIGTLPVAHGEGKFVAEEEVIKKIEGMNLVTLRYCNVLGEATQTYPDNPNGSLQAIAGICDPEGVIFGLMPHPERFVDKNQNPNWRRAPDLEPFGLRFFQSIVNFAKEL